MELPCRILIVGSYNFSGSDATSITLKSLLDDKNNYSKIAFLYTTSRTDLVPKTFGGYKFCLIKPFLFNDIGKKKSIKRIVDGEKPARINNSNGSFTHKIKLLLFEIIRSFRFFIPYKLTKEIRCFILDYKPQIIYTLGGDSNVMSLCVRLSKMLNIPILPHIMDDWFNSNFTDYTALTPFRNLMQRSFIKLLHHSSAGLAICDKMALEYSNTFNVPFYSAMNCIGNINYLEKSIGNPIRVIYSGGLHLNRIQSIHFFCDVVSSITQYKFEVDIYTSENNWKTYGDLLMPFDFVKYKGFVSRQEMVLIQKEADMLLHVESFVPSNRKYTRLSISTKIPEYLSTGRIIVAIGPSDVASIEYIRNNNAGVVCSEYKIEDLSKSIVKVISNNALRDSIIHNAHCLCEKNHLPENSYEIICQCIKDNLKSKKVFD